MKDEEKSIKKAKRKPKRNTSTQDKRTADVLLKEFWRDNEHFADLFNTVLFQGKRILDPQTLLEMDTDVSATIEFKGIYKDIVRRRDVIKRTTYGTDFIICGIEDQENVHYAMPLRTMLYDSLGYLKEYKELQGSFKSQSQRRTSAEFLSDMGKADKLHPIITIVIYYGEKEWDGPYSLSDMMTDIPEEVKKIFVNYEMRLLQVNQSEQYQFSNKEVETVFDISRKLYRKDFDGINEVYSEDMEAELAAVIGKITGSEFILNQAMDGREVMNMCTALEELKKECMEEGLQLGFEQGRRSEKIAIAKTLLQKGLPVNVIADSTRLELEEIERLMVSEEL